jgi:hypothetical protein
LSTVKRNGIMSKSNTKDLLNARWLFGALMIVGLVVIFFANIVHRNVEKLRHQQDVELAELATGARVRVERESFRGYRGTAYRYTFRDDTTDRVLLDKAIQFPNTNWYRTGGDATLAYVYQRSVAAIHDGTRWYTLRFGDPDLEPWWDTYTQRIQTHTDHDWRGMDPLLHDLATIQRVTHEDGRPIVHLKVEADRYHGKPPAGPFSATSSIQWTPDGWRPLRYPFDGVEAATRGRTEHSSE